MSAWIVSKAHIDALVTAAGKCGEQHPGLPPLEDADAPWGIYGE